MFEKNNLNNIMDYQFSKIIIPIYFRNESECEYHLLVDQDNLIHYYEVIWSKVNIQQTTTTAHEKTKKNNFTLYFRKKLLESLNIEHIFGDKNEKKLIKLNSQQIEIMNQYFHNNWYKQTFQNIIYVLMGSNASGEGNPKSASVYTIINNQEKSLSFFLQCLNVTKENYLFSKEVYQNIFKEINQNRVINFDLWVQEDRKLERYLSIFNNYNEPNQWRIDVKKMKKYFSTYRNFKSMINNKVQIKRNEFRKNCENKYKTINDFWKNDCRVKPVYAHIKPVWKIKEQIKEINDFHFEQIADINNCIPLTHDFHNAYDDGEFYWDKNGHLTKNTNYLKNDLDIEKYSENPDMKKYLTIPIDQLNNIKKYLLEYENIFNEIAKK